MSHDLRARVILEPIDGLSGIEMAHVWLGPIFIRSVPCGPQGRQRQFDFVDRVDALIDGRITELLEANNREVEKRRIAERHAAKGADDEGRRG